ncbi:MAG: response regulator [Geobacteraceae bacterium]|nr:MAG: response regulator [Geobacteraceae bacterium]
MTTQIRLLVIEDSEEDVVLLLRELARGGYDPFCRRVDTAETMRAALAGQEWDLVIADYNLPQFNAMTALNILQSSGLDLPFIIVSGKIGEDLAVAAMKAGAHDYLMKNNLQRLVPAIQRELREAAERNRRRQAEEALRNQFEQMNTIFDSINALVYVADMDTHQLIYLNKYGASIFGSDWDGEKCFHMFHTDQIGPCSFCTNGNIAQDGKPLPPHVWEYRNSITGRSYQCIDRAIYWTDGRLVRLEIAIDISERKEMEQLKDEMISAVSHEMRTPLTAMLGFSEFLLGHEVDPAQQRNYLNTIHKETVRLNELIGNFLDMQQIKARRATYRFKAVPVQPLIQDAVDLIALDDNQHRIAIDCPPDLPPVRGDAARLHQVLTNIISNAAKYSPSGSLISIGSHRKGESVILWVKDEGPGIPQEVRDRIFEKFYRLDNTDRRMIGGTGLGLALVREIVTAHNGRVWVESAEGTGSTFYVSLPAFNETQGEEQEG